MLISAKNLSIIVGTKDLHSHSPHYIKIDPKTRTVKAVSGSALYISKLPKPSLVDEFPQLPSTNSHKAPKIDAPLFLDTDYLTPHTDALQRNRRRPAIHNIPVLDNVNVQVPEISDSPDSSKSSLDNGSEKSLPYSYLLESTDLESALQTYDRTEQGHAKCTWPDTDRLQSLTPDPINPALTDSVDVSIAALKDLVTVCKAYGMEHVSVTLTGHQSAINITTYNDTVRARIMPQQPTTAK